MKKLFWRYIPTYLLWIVFAGLVFIMLAMFTGLNTLLVKPLVRDEVPQNADVIIVLGGGVIRETRSLPWGVEERIMRGVDLYKYGYATKMIVTGGLIGRNLYAESDVMAPYAIQQGVPAEDVIEEDKAKDTATNAKYSFQLMQEHGWQTALVVTSDFHTQRACHVFRKQKIDITCVAAYKNPVFKGNPFRNLLDLRAIIREYAATIYYKIKGSI